MHRKILWLLGSTLSLESGSAFATNANLTNVPTLDNWGLIGLAVLAGLIGVVAIRRSRK